MSKSISLFEATKLGSVTLKNRMVMAPMTRNRADTENKPGTMIVEYYRQRATAGLIITEGSQITPQGAGYPGTPGIYSEEQITGWKKVTDAVHESGGKIFLQLWHVGRISHPSLQPDGAIPVAPSAIKPAGEAVTYEGMQEFVTPRELDLAEIKGIIDDYHAATLNAKKAGFDGVEIHAANGYLIDQFIRDKTNKRNDEYGGSIENRTRLLLEVVKTVIDAWDPGHIGVRLSPENTFNDISDSDPQSTFNYVSEQLSAFNLAYLHMLEGEMMTSIRKLDYRQFVDRFNGPYIANSGYSKESAQQALDSHMADAVAFGSLFLANPDLVERFKQNATLNQPDQTTFYGGDEHGYTDYPYMDEASVTA